MATLVIPAAVLAGVAGGVTIAPTTAGAAATAGTAAITKPNTLTALNSGGSGTLYGVQLPAGASCPGDSAHQGYRVDSYLVPKGVSPASVSFKTGLPSKWYGYIAYGEYFGAVNTAEGSGLIVGLAPEFTWTRLTTEELFPHGQKSSTWEGGIACSNNDGVVTDYWNSQIVFTASTSDPHGFTWRVVAQPSLAPSHSYKWLGIGLILLSILLATFAVFLSQRRGKPSSSGPAPGGPTPPGGNPTGGGPTTPAPIRSVTTGAAVTGDGGPDTGRAVAEGQDAPEPSVAGR
jgi:hypothetical protein